MNFDCLIITEALLSHRHMQSKLAKNPTLGLEEMNSPNFSTG